jgi:uncharacterized protein
VTLEADGEAATNLGYTASAQVGGKLAQIGSRLVDGAARKIAGEFFKRFGAYLGGAGADSGADSGTVGLPGGDTANAQAPDNRESDDATGDASGGEATKRKKSWTAWISKS